jgi:hypothetical protein
MSAVVVKRFIGGYSGAERYSIRRHANGTFQNYHDNPFEGTNQGYEHDHQPLPGLYADMERAEAELRRMPGLNLLTEHPT